jgi:hypothetical protein
VRHSNAGGGGGLITYHRTNILLSKIKEKYNIDCRAFQPKKKFPCDTVAVLFTFSVLCASVV